MHSGLCVGAVVLPGTSTVVGTYSGGTNLMGFSATLRPGESDSYGVIFGTASCDARVGYGLAPGNYEAVVPVVVGPSSPPGGALQPLLVTAPAALIVIA